MNETLHYVLFCRDIEAACDEKVIEDFDRQWKVKYSEALLSCAVERRMITVCPLAFGETNVKGRVKGVLNYKKPAFWVTAVTAIICVIMAIGFLTNPKNADDPAVDLSPSALEETEQIVEVSSPPGWRETVLNDSFYEDRIFVEVSRIDYFLRAGHKMLGIWYGVNAYKSVGEAPEYLEVQEPWVKVFGTDSGEYQGGLSAIVDDEGVIRFNINGYVQVNCNGKTTEDGALDMLYLEKAGFQVRADNGQYSLGPRRYVQIAEDISTETVAVNQEMSDEEAEQLRSLAKDISLDTIEPDDYKVSMTCYDEERDLQVILLNKEKDSCILATVPWSVDQNALYSSGEFHEKLQSKPLEFLKTLGQVQIEDFSALIPDRKELDLYIGKTIRDLKKDGFMYSGFESSGHVYRVDYGNRRYCYVVEFEGSDEYENPEYVTEEEILDKTITKIEFEYFGIEMTSKVIFA